MAKRQTPTWAAKRTAFGVDPEPVNSGSVSDGRPVHPFWGMTDSGVIYRVNPYPTAHQGAHDKYVKVDARARMMCALCFGGTSASHSQMG